MLVAKLLRAALPRQSFRIAFAMNLELLVSCSLVVALVK